MVYSIHMVHGVFNGPNITQPTRLRAGTQNGIEYIVYGICIWYRVTMGAIYTEDPTILQYSI